MKCELCGGEMKRELVTYTLFYEGRLVVVENVPADVCHQCGEKLFEPETVERLQNIIWSKQQSVRVIEAPVFDMALAAA